jgi:hypothetical protein
VRFTPAGGSAFLYAKTDMQKAERDKMVNEVTKRLSILKDEYRKLFRIINRKELDRMGADSSALLALAAIPGLVFGGSSEGELTGHITGGHHGYDPHIPQMYTGFIAAGAGINKGAMIQELCVTDIAPLIAKLLGIPFKCPDGKLPAGILQ